MEEEAEVEEDVGERGVDIGIRMLRVFIKEFCGWGVSRM